MLETEMARFRVYDLMSKNFLKVKGGWPIEDVCRMMLDQNSKEALVIEKFDDGERLQGIVTFKDIAKAFLDRGITSRSAADFMRPECLTVQADIPISRVREIMVKSNVGRLPVIWDGRIIGIIHSADLRDSYYGKLESLNRRYREVINQMSEGVTITDPDGNVVLWSRTCEERYGINQDEILNRKLEDFFPTALTLDVLKSKAEIKNVCHSPKPNYYCMISALPIYVDDEFLGVVATERDITDYVNLSLRLQNATLEISYLKNTSEKMNSKIFSGEFVMGTNRKMQKVINLAKRVAATTTSVLITGESGTGKEVIACDIHQCSNRKGRFIPVNCSAIPASLLESEFFGYVGGAFTGALPGGKPGYFEQADKGTIFLDEIGDFPLESQAKLLRVLQEGVIHPVGSAKAVPVDVRVISATNKDLKKMVEAGLFREDLYYRLNVVELQLPTLRERKEDIIPLFNHFVKDFGQKYGIPIENVDKDLLTLLINYNWKGNIRELKNAVEHMVVLSKSKTLDMESLPGYIREQVSLPLIVTKNDVLDMECAVEEFEKELIRMALEHTNGNRMEAAKQLNVKRSTLYYKLKAYNME